MTITVEREFMPLLGDLTDVPAEYIRSCGSIKRFLERWTMDPSFRETYKGAPEATIRSLGLDLTVEEITPFIDDDEARRLTRAIMDGKTEGWPLAVLRYRAFYREKRAHRRQLREEGRSTNPNYALWRSRQINRTVGQLGRHKAEAIVHASAAIELSKGCTVGCWFCGVQAPKLTNNWEYTPESREIWRWTLRVFREVVGDAAARHSFLYWASDPLDNPDYEKFLVDYYEVIGRCPQTTTAMGDKNIERTRSLLKLAHSMNSVIDRFSILNLKMLARIHAGLTPEELIRVECIPQNKEANDKYRKANAGRAREFPKKTGRVMPDEDSSTIACVSGFLFNMVDRVVKLVTPCNANQRWHLGYWVVDEGHFDTAEELRALLEGMIARNMPTGVDPERVIRLRPDVEVDFIENDGIVLRSRWLKITYGKRPFLHQLGRLLAEGTHTTQEIALLREREHDVPLEETMLVLLDMFGKGLFDEEPAERVAEPATA